MADAVKCNKPHVGIGVLILKNGKILMGKRIGAHGEGSWAPPGGKLEHGEEYFDCALREVAEEAGVKIKNLRHGPYTNDIFEEGLHYTTIFVLADYDSGDPRILEPNKCLEWRWCDWNALPEPLFLAIKNLKKQNYVPR